MLDTIMDVLILIGDKEKHKSLSKFSWTLIVSILLIVITLGGCFLYALITTYMF